MEISLPVSQVRQNLSGLLKRLQKNPDQTVLITLSGLPVGELRAPKKNGPRMDAGQALLDLSKKIGKREWVPPQGVILSEHHDDFL